MKEFPTQKGFDGWTAAQLAAVAGRRPENDSIDDGFGEAMRGHVLRADGSFSSDLGQMKIRPEDAVAVSKLIGEHLWIFVVDADGFVIDILPATEAAADELGKRFRASRDEIQGEIEDKILNGTDERADPPLGILHGDTVDRDATKIEEANSEESTRTDVGDALTSQVESSQTIEEPVAEKIAAKIDAGEGAE